MTRITIQIADGEAAIIANGHANTAEACAAVSTLMSTLVCYLHNSRIKVSEERLEPGDSLARYSLKSKEAKVITRYMALAFLQLQMSEAVEIDPKSNLGEIFGRK